MKWLVWLYPARWRRRYGEEFLAVLDQQPLTPRILVDILRGALDARLHPRPISRARPVRSCSFCGKSQDTVRRMIAGPGGVYICDECLALCTRILEQEEGHGPAEATGPRQPRRKCHYQRWRRIVLNRHRIVHQPT
jgi:hypothetical protein